MLEQIYVDHLWLSRDKPSGFKGLDSKGQTGGGMMALCVFELYK